MAGGGFQVEGKGRKYESGVTAFMIITCLVAAFGGLIIGYDIGISGVTSMDSFLSKFFPSVYQKEHETYHNENMYCKFNSHLLTLFTSSLYLAALVASFFASSVTRNLGRKVSMFVGGSVFLIGTILNGVAMNVSMLIIGRLLLGIGVGFTGQSIPIYLSEMPPANIRGALNIGFQMAITIGILVANLINYGTAKIQSGWAWRLSLSLAAVPATMITIGSFFLPDTPNSMIQRGHAEEAKRMLQKIRGTDNVEEEFRDLVDATEAAREEENPWKSILQQRYRPQLTMCLLIPFFQQLTGINVIMFYAPVLFKTLGVGNDASLLSAVITGTVNVIATVVSIYCVDKFGRRILFLEGGIQMIICQIIVGVMIAINFGQAGLGSLSHGEADFVLFLICAYVAAFAWSWGPLAILVPSEICPLEMRPAGQAINASVNMFFTFVIGQFFLTMLCHMKFGLFWFFGGFVVIMTIFIFFFLPETRNVPIEQMGNVWKAHWFWGKYIPDELVGGKFSLGQRT